MTSKAASKPKPLIWMGDSLERLQKFPEDVQDEMGFALFQAQTGEKHLKAKPLKGLGAGISRSYPTIAAIRFALSTQCDSRAMSTCFMPFRRSRRRVSRRRRRRWNWSNSGSNARSRCTSYGRIGMGKADFIESSGNVFADLGLANAEERLAKAELANKIGNLLRQDGLTQVQAAAVLGVDQPKVSALLCGQLARFSIEKLVQFLLLLGQDVSIQIKPRQRVRSKPRRSGPSGKGRLTVDEAGMVKVSKGRAKRGEIG